MNTSKLSYYATIEGPVNEPPRFDPLSPAAAVARTIKRMEYAFHNESGVRMEDLAVMLEEQGRAAANGDFSHVRSVLASQVQLLERLSDYLVNKALASSNHFEVSERYLRLAFRAQAQCARTATVLKKMEEPAAASSSSAPPSPDPAVAPVVVDPAPISTPSQAGRVNPVPGSSKPRPAAMSWIRARQSP